jgi:tetratricopeptide (TPR) repeat protein
VVKSTAAAVILLWLISPAVATDGPMLTNTSSPNCRINAHDSDYDYAEEIKSSPNDPNLYLKRAGYHMCHSKWNDAIHDYNEAIRLDPSMARAYEERGSVYYAAGEVALAMQDHIRAIELVPEDKLTKDDSIMFMNLGIDYQAEKRNVQATLEFNKAMQLDPYNPAPVYDRGLSYLDRREYRKSLVDLTAAIRLDPLFLVEAREIRGRAYMMYGRPDLAIEDFDFVLRKTKNYARAFEGRCRSKALANTDLEGALNDCNEALRLQPAYYEAQDARAFVELRLQRNTDAIADYNAELQRDPNNPHALFGIALAEKAAGFAADAQRDSETATKYDSRIAYYYELNFKGLVYSEPPACDPGVKCE